MVLSSDNSVGQLSYSPLESVKRSPPQELKLQPASAQDLDFEKKEINLPTITIIESSPIHEYSAEKNFASKLAPTAVQSTPTHALSESHPLPVASHSSEFNIDRETPTIEALIKATKATFSKEEFKMKFESSCQGRELSVPVPTVPKHEEVKQTVKEKVEDSNNNSPGKPKPSDLPPLKTLTITCPSSPLLQRHALLQAQKEGVKFSPPLLRHNTTPKKSPPLFRTSLTEIENRSREIDGSFGSLSPKLTRRFSGQGSPLLEMRAKSSSIDKQESSLSPSLSKPVSNSKTEMDNEFTNNEMEVDDKSLSSRSSTSDLDMTVRSGMIDSMNVRKPEGKKNVTFLLELDKQLECFDTDSKGSSDIDVDMSVQSGEPSASIKSSSGQTVEQEKPMKTGKKKGPLGIVMGKAAIAARAVSSSAHRSSGSSSSRKQAVSSTKSLLKSESVPIRKHSHSQCVMGTSAAHTSRTAHMSCVTCGRRRAASQSNVSSEPPTKQQAKGKQSPVRKTSLELDQKKSKDGGQSSKNTSPREEAGTQKSSKNSSNVKKERKPFFV